MTDLLNPSEVLNFAITIEEMGYRFYIDAIKKVDHKEMIKLFQVLADQEFQHQNIFKIIREELDQYQPIESYPGEYKNYMMEFLKGHSLADETKLRKIINGIIGIKDAIQAALGFEQDSIVFFSMLKKMVNPKHQEVIESVIQEEVSHIFMINKMVKKLNLL